MNLPSSKKLLFVGGGNMASAIIQGLVRQGWSQENIAVLEPNASARSALAAQGLMHVYNKNEDQNAAASADMVIWAVKPQNLAQAAAEIAPTCSPEALHLSIAAGIPIELLSRWIGSLRIIRAMPNTPALVAQGITGLYAAPGLAPEAKKLAMQLTEAVLSGCGRCLWLEREEHLDAVTALSGSGPAYVFLLLEVMSAAGQEMGLSRDLAYELAKATFSGATALAEHSDEDACVLRQRVTSKGGTTHAAISYMQEQRLPEHFAEAMHRAYQRAQEIAQEAIQADNSKQTSNEMKLN